MKNLMVINWWKIIIFTALALILGLFWSRLSPVLAQTCPAEYTTAGGCVYPTSGSVNITDIKTDPRVRFNLSYSLIKHAGTDADPYGPYENAVLGGWKIMFGLATAAVAIILLFLAFVNISHINYDTYQIKKSLPLLILGYIMAAFSLFISRMFIDAANVLTQTFTQGSITDTLFTPLIFNLGLPGVGTSTGTAYLLGLLLGAAAFGPILIGLLILTLVIVLLPIIGMLIIVFLLYIRIAVVLFLAAVAPVAFVCLAFAPAQVVFKQWWSNWTKWVFMKPIMFLILWLAVKLGSNGATNPGVGHDISIASFLITLGLTYFAFTVPLKLGGAVMDAWAKLGQWASGTGKGGYLTKFATKQGANAGKEVWGGLLRNVKPIRRMVVGDQLQTNALDRGILRGAENDWMLRGQELNRRRQADPSYVLTEKDKQVMKENYKIAVGESDIYMTEAPERLNERMQKLADDGDLAQFLQGNLTDPIKNREVLGVLRAAQVRQHNVADKPVFDAADAFTRANGVVTAGLGGRPVDLRNVSLAGFNFGTPAPTGTGGGGGPTPHPAPGGGSTGGSGGNPPPSGGGGTTPPNTGPAPTPDFGNLNVNINQATNYFRQLGLETEHLRQVFAAIYNQGNTQDVEQAAAREMMVKLKLDDAEINQALEALKNRQLDNLGQGLKVKLAPQVDFFKHMQSGKFQQDMGVLQKRIQQQMDEVFNQEVAVPIRVAFNVLPQNFQPSDLKAAEDKIQLALKDIPSSLANVELAREVVAKIDPKMNAKVNITNVGEARRHLQNALQGVRQLQVQSINDLLPKEGQPGQANEELIKAVVAKANEEFRRQHLPENKKDDNVG